MKKIVLVGLQMWLLTPVLATAQSAFNGTWKLNDDKTQYSKKPYVYLLHDGVYHCETCVPPLSVPADGQDHKVTGHPYYDTANIKVVGDRTIEETYKEDGKPSLSRRTTVSADGKTAKSEGSETSVSNGTVVTFSGDMTRVAKGPDGSHSISGSWNLERANASDNLRTFTLKFDGDSLSMTGPMGDSYTAKLDGTEAPYQGNPGVDHVSVKWLGNNTVEETDRYDGKVIDVMRLTVSPDGKTMTLLDNDKLHDRTVHWVAEKQ